jgi:RHS repeat-associated protein
VISAAAAAGTSAAAARSMPGGRTPGSARAGNTTVWVGPAATRGAVTPARQKTKADQAQYPRYRQHGRLAARPRGAPATGRSGRAPAVASPAYRPKTLSGSAAQAGTAPVWSARVRVLPHQVAKALGIAGTVFTVARADGSAAAGRVHVSFDYAGFEYAYGGNYAARLRLVELPSCALTTPRAAACATQTPLVSGDDVAAATAGADVIVPGSTAAQPGHGVVLALTPSAQGSTGDYAAEPVSEMDQWLSTGSSGAYKYTDDIAVPPVPGGLEPNASLQYDSQLTDGITAAVNPEASEVGDGWKSTAPGYIETNYQTCAANWSEPDILDLCDQVETTSLSMNGAVGPIVLPSSGGDKREADDTSDVQPLSGGGWEIIDPDGAQYYYGLNKLPGWTTGDPLTNSIWTVPLWAGGSELTTAAPWRYMLDYEVDAEGDSIAYFYNTQNNYYATDGGSTGNGAYTAGGVLSKVEYGLRNNGNVFSQTPAAEINYTYSTTRQDAPTDLACTNGAACSVNSPTFWTGYALTGISTESLNGSTLKPVDSYVLADSFPATGDPTSSPNLWLSSIQQTGQDGSPTVTLPAVQFGATPMPNLDQTSADKTDGYSLLTRDRLTTITNESGGKTGIVYTGEESACSSGKFPSLWANADQCYPNYWYTNALADTEQLDWYNLYATASITQTDTTGGGKPVVTAYIYGTPGWHYDNDDGSQSAYPTWDEWRGFQTVTTETGTSPDPVTKTVDTYFQGLSDDEGAYSVSGGGEEGNGTINITTSRGVVVQDQDQYAGTMLEERVFNGASGSEVTDTEYDVPWSAETAAQTINSSLYEYADAYLSDTTGTAQYTDLASGGSDESTVTETLDSKDNVLSEDDKPWGAAETCKTTSYVTNTTSNLTEPETVKVNAGSCASPGALVSETQYGYDGGSIGTAPTKGLVTEVQKTITTSGTTATTLTSYDEYGRVISVTDPDNRVTTTAYTPATGAEPTQVTVTDPMSLTTTTTYDPARELPLTATTPAGYATTISYDALGRATAKWTPGNPTSGNPQVKYSYIVSQTAPAAVITQTQEPGGGYLTSTALYDSLGRAIETQAGTASGGSDITQDSYNSDGLKSFAEGPYYTSTAPSGTLVTAANTTVTDETGYAYDGDRRMTTQTAYDDDTATWDTTWTYGGNYVTEVPPSGGTSQTTFGNGLGQETAVYQYHSGVSPSPSDPAADYDQTSYAYTPAGGLAGITDAATNQWSFGYDLLGRMTSQTLPDSGTTTATYDAAGQLMTATDARGKTISITYDNDGRKTAEYDTTGGAPENSADELDAWTWDTLAKGELTSSTSYSGGAAYTQAVTGYNSQGLPSGQQTVIPSAQGKLAGTYTTSDTYAADGDQLSYTDSAAGGLPAETVTTGYDTAGNPVSLTGASTYVDSLSYTGLDQPLEYTLGTTSSPAYITDSYDPQTANITEQQVQDGTAATTVDDLHYSYDAAGLITSEADTPSGATADTDVQCFSYDYLGRIAEAWAQGSTGCASSPTYANEGGPAPYLEQYSYNTENDLTGITSTSTAGAVSSTTLAYPAPGSAHPHAVTSSTTTGASTSNASYGYDADGNLTTVSGSAGSQSLTWSDNGQLAQIAVTPSGGGTAQDTGFVYDTGGNELIRTDPGSVTLYLSDEELVLNTSTGTVTGTRYYTIGGQQIAASTYTSGGVLVAWMAGDSQHTETIAISASTLVVARRWYDPYGNPVGPGAPAFPDGEKGFVGGTSDTATGLVDLGAREYQSATGSFISVDSILKAADPQDLDPYAYSEDDPVTYSDPSGMSTGPAADITLWDDKSNPIGTPFGKMTISVDVSLKTGKDSLIDVHIEGDGNVSVEVATPYGTVSFTLETADVLVEIVSGAAKEEQERMATPSRNTAVDDYSYSQDYDLRGGTASLSVGWGSVSASLEGSVTKDKVTIDYTLTVKLEVEVHPARPNASPQLERVIQAGEKAAAQGTGIAAAASLGAAAALWWLVVLVFD